MNSDGFNAEFDKDFLKQLLDVIRILQNDLLELGNEVSVLRKRVEHLENENSV